MIIVFQSDVKFRDKEFLKFEFGSFTKGQSFIQGMPFRAVHIEFGETAALPYFVPSPLHLLNATVCLNGGMLNARQNSKTSSCFRTDAMSL